MHDYKKPVLNPVGNIEVKIDFDSIPEHQRNQLAEFALEVT